MQKAIHGTLVANTAVTVTLDGGWAVGTAVLVMNISGGAPLYVRLDGVDPTVKGNDSRAVVDWRSFDFREEGTNLVSVRLICAAASDYSIEVVR